MPLGKIVKVVSAKPMSKTSKLERQVKTLNRKVKVLTPEINYSNAIENAANSSYDGALRTIATSVSQGDTDTTRSGDMINLKECELRMFLNSGATTCALRVIVFIDKQNSSAAVTDVIESGTIGVGNLSNAVDGLFVHDYESRYKVLMDRTITFSANGTNSASLVKKFYFKRGLIQRYLAGGTAPIENALKMIYIGTGAAGATPLVNWQSRSEFVDV